MSVREIAAKAADFEFNPFIAIKYWMRTADTLLREAHIYENEDNDQQAYLLLMRYATLVSEKLPLHPAAKQVENRAALKAVQKGLPGIIERLTALKPRIEHRYQLWQKAVERMNAASAAKEGAKLRLSSRSLVEFAASDPAVAGNTATLAADEHSELAVKHAQKIIRRRDAARKATRQAGVSKEEEQERRTAGLWDDWEAALEQKDWPPIPDDNEVRSDMEATRRQTDGQYNTVSERAKKRLSKAPPRPPRPEERNGLSGYRYPSISRSQPLHYSEDGSSDSRIRSVEGRPRSRSPHGQNLPPKPPKERYSESTPAAAPGTILTPLPLPPERPQKIMLNPHAPDIDSADKYTFAPASYLENGEPLRTVFLPPTLRKKFLEYAAPNTRKNLETCGMLCGTLIANALFISRVVIPEQESTSDTCETINESDLFDYCASEDLMVLGWIHTHPTQTCFMSSRDLHTHAGYQTMMPESIAIVCAPTKDPSWGIFRLTDPPGKQAILNCTKTGLFHLHDVEHIYTDARRPAGHVLDAPALEYEVVDLRP